MTYTGPNNDESAQAIQHKIGYNKDRGYGVIGSGATLGTGSYAVTINTGTINSTDTLSVGSASDEALYDGDVVSLSGATDIGISGVSAASDGTEQYRYDIIWADATGEVNKTEGTVTELSTEEDNNNLTNFERFVAPIPEPATYPSVVIAAVVVSSEDNSIGSDNLRDYRVDADSLNNKVSAQSLNGSVTGDNTLTDLFGQGLEFASGSLQILTSIWDGTNLVADVANSLVDTDEIQNKDYNEAVNSIANATGTTDIDLSLANMHEVEADGNVTITFSNVTTTPEGNSMLIRLYDDDATGPHTITWPASVEWTNGTVRDTVESGGEIEIALRTYDGGTTWKASRSGRDFA